MRKVVVFIFLSVFLAQSSIIKASSVSYGDKLTNDENVRIGSYLSKYPVQFNEGEKDVLVSKCQNAQDRILLVSKNLPDIITRRKNVYGHIDSRLASIQSRLSLQQIDTSTIDLMLVNYRREIISFDDKMLKYQQSLSDITKLDCVAYPEAFKANLEAVREYRKNIQESSQSIKDLNRGDLSNGFNLIANKLREQQ